MNDTWLQINKERPRNIVLIVRLIEEHILSVLVLGGVRLKNTIRSDTVLSAKLFPEFVTDYFGKKI